MSVKREQNPVGLAIANLDSLDVERELHRVRQHELVRDVEAPVGAPHRARLREERGREPGELWAGIGRRHGGAGVRCSPRLRRGRYPRHRDQRCDENREPQRTPPRHPGDRLVRYLPPITHSGSAPTLTGPAEMADFDGRPEVCSGAWDRGTNWILAAGSLASPSVSSPNRLDFYDVELRAQHEHLRAAYGIGRGDEVLDIGCGTGLTTREAGRASAPGRVLGLDVSERMLERARELTVRERLENVSYELGDAQVSRFDHERFEVAISRFGTMFFSDPAAAFANISSALRPRGRLVLLVWQHRELNQWALAIDAALGSAAQLPPPTADPFSLGDAKATTEMLERAGFEAVRLEDVREPVLYGHDIDAALQFVCGFQDVSAALARMSHDDDARAVNRLRETLEAHYGDNQGVAFDSRSWLITARRP